LVGETLTDVADDGSQQRKPDFRTAVEDVKAVATVLAMEAESVLGRRPARFLGILALLAIVVGTLLFLLDWYIDPAKAGERKDLILTLAQILGGMALLSGLYFTWRTLQVNREGQITERFTRAIDQLGKTDDEGNKLFEIRLGGIYALERIARESEEDHWPIMEVLTAYVRQHAPWRPEEGQQGEEDAAIEKPKEDSRSSRGEVEPTEVPAPDPDIQAILTVLRRRTRYFGHGELGQINLSRTDLRAANLVETHLERADLRGAHLERARLKSAHLEEAQLINAHLEQANLEKAHLEGANLQGAHMQRSILREAHLKKAILPHVHLEKAGLYKAHLEGAQLQGAHLQGAVLREAHLEGTRLRLADLSGADLTGAEVTEKQLDTARSLEGATMPDGSVHD
jgi:uncharacterized protein YjbI with pentapeptide repeats